MVVLHMLLTFVLLCDASNHSFQFYPFQNNISLSFRDRVKVGETFYVIDTRYDTIGYPLFQSFFFQDLVDRLSLEEIVEQLSHGGAEFNGMNDYYIGTIFL